MPLPDEERPVFDPAGRLPSTVVRQHPVRVAQLFVVTVAYIALLPAAESWPRLLQASEVALIAAAVVVCGTGRRQAVLAAALGIPAAFLAWVAPLAGSDAVRWSSFVLKSALLIYVLVLMLARIFRTRVVTVETVGLARPGSFSCFAEGVHPPGWESELVYFSFITMATVGYGDIAPVSPVARSLAMLQAVTGTMFIAVVIAGLLNRTSARRGV